MRRRDLLKLGGMAITGAALAPGTARAQQARRGGVVTIRAWDPPHFDPHLTIAYKMIVPTSFTHSRLVRHKAGPAIAPGTFTIEGDLAESWSQPNDTTYVFKLRRGARWHGKPPVNGREVTADDVVYSLERFRTVKGNANAYMLDAVAKVEAPDHATVRVTLKEPFAWFLDMLAFPGAVVVVARESVDSTATARTSASRWSATRSTSCPACPTSTTSSWWWTRTTPRASAESFSDVRVRRAIALAVDRQGVIEAVQDGVGALNPPLRAFLKDWALPVDQLGEGARYYQHDPAEARRLLAAAGYPQALRVHRARGHPPARAEGPEGRRHRREGGPEGVRR